VPLFHDQAGQVCNSPSYLLSEMFDVTQTTRPVSSTEAATASNEGVLHLKVEDGDTYADREAAYLDNIDRIYRLVNTGAGNRSDAEDLTAEVFKAALGRLRLDSPKEEVRANLLATARILLASHWRSRMKRPATFVHSDTITAVGDERSEPNVGVAGRNSNPVISELRLLKYMSERDATLAAGVSQTSGNAPQYRALFVAANLAEGDK
jgi:DNA-directed RNA polymerase specialized sigma24 family protein